MPEARGVTTDTGGRTATAGSGSEPRVTRVNGGIALTAFALAAAALLLGKQIGVNEGFGGDGKLDASPAANQPASWPTGPART